MPRRFASTSVSRTGPAADAEKPSSDDCLAMRRECASFNARRAERALADLYNDRMGSLQISVAQIPLLAILCSQGSTPLGRLAEIVELDPSTLSRNLALLERRGLITFRTGTDRRIRHVELSDFGQEQFHEAYARWGEVQAEMRAAFPDDELDQMLKSIRRLGAWAKRASVQTSSRRTSRTPSRGTA